MHKVIIAAAVAVTAGFVAPHAEAQNYPAVRDVTQFTQSANYMSLVGYHRYRYYLDTGRWISRQEAENVVRAQLGFVPSAPTGQSPSAP